MCLLYLQFVNLMYGPWKIDPSDKKKSAMKMVCLGEDQKVRGSHAERLVVECILRRSLGAVISVQILS